MHYFAHTLKGCGPVALALALSACGEETTSIADAASVAQNTEDTQTIGQYVRSVSDIFSQNQAQQAIFASASALAVTAQQRSVETSAPVAPVRGNLDKVELIDSNTLITAPVQNQQPIQTVVTRPEPGRDSQDELPVEPPIGVADDEFGPGDPDGPSLEQPPLIGADPLVTLIAKTDSDLNSSGTKLVWSTENVDSCQASGAWEGGIATNGSLDLQHAESGDLTYMIKCEGAGGTAMAMVTVTVESTTLAWEAPVQNTNGTQLNDLAGYNLYYGTESGRYTQVRPVRDPSQTNLELPIEPGTYFVAMTAYDASGNESELSNEIVRQVY